MKRIFKNVLAIACAAVSVFGFTACGSETVAESTALGSPKDTTTIAYSERKNDNVKLISEGAENFAADFASLAYKGYDENENFTVAPVSVFMALSLAAQCSEGNTRSEILSALGVSYDRLLNGFSDYYRSLFAEYKCEDKLTGFIDFSNSVWLDNGTSAKQDCIDTLAEKFHCYSYKAGFYENNRAANAAVREFVKDKTRGIIDKDFNLGEETLFALINTLYLKDIWNSYGYDLQFTGNAYDFVNYDATKTNTKLLQGYYCEGKVYESETYKTFFTSTVNENKIKFILPNEEYTVDEIFTSENLAEINSITNYNAVDEENKIKYYTRCLFPEFTAEYNEDIIELLKVMGISDMFSREKCDFSPITADKAYCSEVLHATKLKVDKKGIEGAAVTIIEVSGDSAPIYEKVYSDFIVDKAFGFILTDRYDNTLFSGVIKNV